MKKTASRMLKTKAMPRSFRTLVADLRLRQEIGNGCQGIAERDIVGFLERIKDLLCQTEIFGGDDHQHGEHDGEDRAVHGVLPAGKHRP